MKIISLFHYIIEADELRDYHSLTLVLRAVIVPEPWPRCYGRIWPAGQVQPAPLRLISPSSVLQPSVAGGISPPPQHSRGSPPLTHWSREASLANGAPPAWPPRSRFLSPVSLRLLAYFTFLRFLLPLFHLPSAFRSASPRRNR